jgi:hypothetical protein
VFGNLTTSIGVTLRFHYNQVQRVKGCVCNSFAARGFPCGRSGYVSWWVS